jgi:flagellar FliL protein
VSAKPEAAEAVKAPAKGKKMLIIILGVVLLLALIGGGAIVFISKQRSSSDDGGDGHAPAPAKAEAPRVVQATVPKTPPVYLPLDNMVVNLADPGGERVAQIGITLEVQDAKAVLPAIRSSVLMLIARRTSEELLKQEGKEKLIRDILCEASIPFGGDSCDEEEEQTSSAKAKKKKPRAVVLYPVVGVLFSSFIVQ